MTYRPEHCRTCQCEPVGALPTEIPVDPHCPEHGNLPTAYPDCSCFRAAERAAPAEPTAALTTEPNHPGDVLGDAASEETR